MNKFFKLFSGLLCLPLIGGIMMNSTTRDVVRADAATESFSTTYSYGKNLVVTNYTDKGDFCLVPSSGYSVASFETIFNGKSISGNVTVTINNATFGSGTNPSESTFTFYSDKECLNQISATISGKLPTSSTFVNTVYTIVDTSITGDNLFLKITKPGKQIRLKSVKIEFNYTVGSEPFLQFDEGVKGIKSVGETASYPATIANATGSEGPISYTSSNKSVATVDSNGKVTATGVGTTKITASCDSLTAVSFDMKVYSKNTGLSSDSPLSGEEARDFYNDGVYDPTYELYFVGGYVSNISGSKYSIDSDSFVFYNCTFDSGLDSSTIAVGSYLVGCGAFTTYKGQVEFNAGTIFVIKNKEVSSISITGELSTNSTTIYQNALAEWKYADLVVNAIYDDATTADVTTAATWTFDPATPNDVDLGEESQKVVDVKFTAHYNNLVASVTKSITVKKDKATSLSITNQKTEFAIGEYFSIGTGTIKVNHSSNTSTTIGLEDVIVLLGGVEIDVNTYILSASDNGKTVDFKYTENGVTVSLKSKYTITVNSTLTFTGDMSSLLSGIADGTKVTKLNINDVVTLSASTEGDNKPQSYGTGTEWRLYQNGGSIYTTTLTISLPTYGYELESVTITYKANNKGTLLLASDNTTEIASGTEVTCTGKSISFVVGGSSTKANGQAKITKVVVKANYDALGTWCDSFLGDLVCDPTGRTAPSTDTWATLGNLFLANLTSEMQAYMANYNTSNSKSVVNRALVKYDYIIEKYNTEAADPYLDFIERIDAGKITLKSNNLFIPMEITSSSFAIITFIALASITAIGGYLVIKRRKEN